MSIVNPFTSPPMIIPNGPNALPSANAASPADDNPWLRLVNFTFVSSMPEAKPFNASLALAPASANCLSYSNSFFCASILAFSTSLRPSVLTRNLPNASAAFLSASDILAVVLALAPAAPDSSPI